MGKHLSGHFLLLLYVWGKEGGLRNTVLSWSHQITLRSLNSWICDFRTPNLHPELSLQRHLTRLTYGFWFFTPPLSKEEHGETIDMVFSEASIWHHSSDPPSLFFSLEYVFHISLPLSEQKQSELQNPRTTNHELPWAMTLPSRFLNSLSYSFLMSL